MGKKKKTAYVGFRIEEDILKRFDEKAAEYGIKRADLLRQYMRIETGSFIAEFKEVRIMTERLKRLEEAVVAFRKVKNQYKDIIRLANIPEEADWTKEDSDNG